MVFLQALRSSYGVAPELVELGNLATVGERILLAALQRRESRGAHFRSDFPHKVDLLRDRLPAAAAAKHSRQRKHALVPAATSSDGVRRQERCGPGSKNRRRGLPAAKATLP